MELTEDTFLIYAAQHYTTPQLSTEEFEADINRIKCVRRLFAAYNKTGKINARLALNHIIIVYNCFETDAATRMLFFKLEGFLTTLKPFLVYLNYWPSGPIVTRKGMTPIPDSDIPLDLEVLNQLRDITWQSREQ